MIFGKKRKAAKQESPETSDQVESDLSTKDDQPGGTAEAVGDSPEQDEADSVTESGDEESGDEESGDEESGDQESGDRDRAGEDSAELSEEEQKWAELDLGEYREEGPFDFDEVDLTDDPIERLDLGALILTPFKGAELRLNVVENSRKVISVLMAKGDSALEVAVFAAPNSGGMWTEVRQKLVEETEKAGGSVKLVEGPFGTELRRLMPAKGPNGEEGVQPTRTWMAQGPRWALRGVVYGRAALTESLDDEPVAPFFDAFRDVIVRRGDGPLRAGEVLSMTLPEGVRQTKSPEQAAGPGQSTDPNPAEEPESN